MTGTGLILYPSVGPQVGNGHLFRLFNLAEALERCSICVEDAFVEDIRKAVEDKKLSGRVETVLPASAVMAGKQAASTVVLDRLHHGNRAVVAKEVQTLNSLHHKTVVIDSMPDDDFRPLGHAEFDLPDLVIAPYIGAEHCYDQPQTKAKSWVGGGQYAIVPKRFAALAQQRAKGDPDHVLITCGGSDPSQLSLALARIAANTKWPVDLVIGPYFANALKESLQQIARHQPRLALHDGLVELDALYLKAKVVIGRAGLTRYEAAALQIPGIYLHEGANYIDYFARFRESGAAEVYFSDDPAEREAFFRRVTEIVTAIEPTFGEFVEKSLSVDCDGSIRFAETILTV